MQLAPKHGYAGWTRAAIIGALVTGVSVIGLVVIPAVIAQKMSTSASLLLRDATVLGWTAAFFVAAGWAFVRAQAGRKTVEVAEVPEDEEVAA